MSKNAIALIMFAVGWYGLDVSETQVQEGLMAGMQFISFAVMIYNQVKREDIKWFFWKK